MLEGRVIAGVISIMSKINLLLNLASLAALTRYYIQSVVTEMFSSE